MKKLWGSCTALLLFAVHVTALPNALWAETLASSLFDFRIYLYLKVKDEAAKALLPSGYSLAPWSGGPFAGTNLMIVFVDQYGRYDLQNKALRDTGFLAASIITWRRNEQAGVNWRIFGAHSFQSDDVVPTDRDRIVAKVRREMSCASDGISYGGGSENWSVSVADDQQLEFTMTFDGRAPLFATQEARVTSTTAPDGPRQIRRNEVVSYLLPGPAAPESVVEGRDSLRDYRLISTIESLRPFLDGTEQLVSIRIIPTVTSRRFDP
ncbi:MAG: hypothetical protein AAFY56_13435 [Pseudomonadota bacterium]